MDDLNPCPFCGGVSDRGAAMSAKRRKTRYSYHVQSLPGAIGQMPSFDAAPLPQDSGFFISNCTPGSHMRFEWPEPPERAVNHIKLGEPHD